MKKTLTWLGVTVGSLAVFAGAGLGLTLVNKDSLATHFIEKYTGSSKDSSSSSRNTSSSSTEAADAVTLKVTKSSNLDSILNNGEFNGSAALNTGKKVLVSSRGYGNHDTKKSMTSSSKFLIGKVQDTINGGIIMHLIDSGKVKLNDKLSKYDKNVAGSDTVTVKEVMNQASGISATDLASSGSTASLAKAVNDNASYDPANAGIYIDSRVNTILQAAIIEKATGSKYQTVVQDLIDQLGLEQTTFGMKERTVEYYQVGDTVSATKVATADLNTDAIDRMGDDQLVSSPGDIAQLYSYLFNSDYVSSSTIGKVFNTSGSHIAGFAVDGDSLSMAQAITGGRNRIEWNLKKNSGTFLFSNYINGQDNLSTISSNMLDYLN
ncbi:beta-lactamase family protein [Pediococcus stilesii]|uniref:Beta-lactamase family protein n=1 Tax=Pediococcus stilesii TaxID=331679 RepID=A0A5R9BRP6_9LACO|nr:serine hydrolase domain-containing protein [Pediococcus stilesii]TLQ03376.1 beta-lactamase family protein [Pediococcus stilesii]